MHSRNLDLPLTKPGRYGSMDLAFMLSVDFRMRKYTFHPEFGKPTPGWKILTVNEASEHEITNNKLSKLPFHQIGH